MLFASLPVIVMVSSPPFPYDVGEMRSESRPHALNATVLSINFLSAVGRTLPPPPSRHWFRTPMFSALLPLIVMVSSPPRPYDVGEMRSESQPRALDTSRASTSHPRQGEHFLRAPSRHWFRTQISLAPSPVIVMVSSP